MPMAINTLYICATSALTELYNENKNTRDLAAHSETINIDKFVKNKKRARAHTHTQTDFRSFCNYIPT